RVSRCRSRPFCWRCCCCRCANPGIARATQRTIQKWLGYAEVRFHDTPIASAEFAPSGRASTVQSTDEEAAILPREDKHTPRAAAPQQGASAAAEKLSAAINAAIGSESDSGGSRSSDSDDEGEGGEGEEVEGSVVVPVLSPVLVDGPGETRPLTVVYRLQVGRPSGKGAASAARYEQRAFRVNAHLTVEHDEPTLTFVDEPVEGVELPAEAPGDKCRDTTA
ncbi:hypothetical protein EMIHUDRAFT_438025, partial [Emiliania huxleyi CCMP1516]|uniref:Uncharacterized protein n=2 Tax=Emiliania huxleyi TaxID=2903 RepID=A0A0D3IEU8_EMIH1